MRRRTQLGLSGMMMSVLAGVGVVGLLLVWSELPALRRYIRMKRM